MMFLRNRLVCEKEREYDAKHNFYIEYYFIKFKGGYFAKNGFSDMVASKSV